MITLWNSIFNLALCLVIVSNLFSQSDSLRNCEEQFQDWKQQQVSDFIDGPYDFPKVVTQENPVYPDSAKKYGLEGTVIIWFLVDTNGNPQRPRILQTAGYGFDEAALSVIRKWRFNPVS
jgi:TonB family protein